jgi:parvulin-like peptidyl-prolyl isomerase
MACGIALMVAGLSSGGEPELPAGAVLRVGEVSLGAEEILRRAGSDSETTAAKAIEQVVVDEALFQRGVALGLVTSDAIIRRRVVEAVRSLVTAEEAAREPSEEELRAYHERHKKLFTGEPRYRLSEMVLASGRGPEPRILRETIQEGLRSGESFKDLSIEHGDTSFSCFEPGLGYTEGELVATRGRAFSRAVKATPVRRLSPPVPGPGGVHLVRVEEVLRGDLLSFDEARAAVLNRWRRNASLEAFAHYVEEVRSEAEVWVAPDAEARVGRALESRGVISP